MLLAKHVKLIHYKAVLSVLILMQNMTIVLQTCCCLLLQKNSMFLLSGLQIQKLFSFFTMIRKHMWPWILRIMLLIPEVSCLPTEAPEKVKTRKIKITSCTQASLSSSSLMWSVASFF